jgi:hypothetical protein
MSQIEIDKSKKVFDNISMSKELSKMKNIAYIRYVYEEDAYSVLAKKMVVPKFFNMVSKSNDYRIFETFNTPMDILQDILVFDASKYQKGEKSKEFLDLLCNSKDVVGRISKDSVNAMYKIIEVCGKRINGLKLKSCTLHTEAKKTVERKVKKEAMSQLEKLKPSDATILYVLKQCFGEKEDDIFGFKKYSILTLNLLFVVKRLQVLKCFRKKDATMEEVLIKIKDDCGMDIFGEKYHKTKINTLRL